MDTYIWAASAFSSFDAFFTMQYTETNYEQFYELIKQPQFNPEPPYDLNKQMRPSARTLAVSMYLFLLPVSDQMKRLTAHRPEELVFTFSHSKHQSESNISQFKGSRMVDAEVGPARRKRKELTEGVCFL